MTIHASIPADDPERVARVIAELWRGEARRVLARNKFRLELMNEHEWRRYRESLDAESWLKRGTPGPARA